MGEGRIIAAARRRRGKSGLQRAGCWVTPRGGDPWKAQQKADRLPVAGKGETAVQETTGYSGDVVCQACPNRSKTK